jgi:hypothetical protein
MTAASVALAVKQGGCGSARVVVRACRVVLALLPGSR